ncbi:MAG: GNAT family N-acetyltransferase [Bacteroidetes bacterium]|nr:GNAT family N-acetyltransferase [Bacteroidota bacterium]
MTSLQVRLLKPADALEVADLHLQIWQQAYAPIFGAERLQQLPAAEFRNVWQERLEEGGYQCLGVFREKQLAGFCGWGEYSNTEAEIYHFYLHPDYWGLGIAEKIMDHLLIVISSAGYSEVVLWTLKENGRAQRFYQKWGFATTGKMQQRSRYGLLLQEIQMKRSATSL